MEHQNLSNTQLIAMAYEKYCDSVRGYITYRINDANEAADMTQDVFLKLMEHYDILYTDTIRNLIYTLVKNRINDYFRRSYKKNEVYSYIYDRQSRKENVIESNLNARNIQEMELRIVDKMPQQRRRIYRMVRFDERNTEDIAEELHISKRTVKAHQYIAQYEVRHSLLKII
jgi:RNA polymerase sigma factor (sigma-70 family)